jgi:hypothetical protein
MSVTGRPIRNARKPVRWNERRLRSSVRALVAVPPQRRRKTSFEARGDLRLGKSDLDADQLPHVVGLYLGGAELDARHERAVLGPEVDRRRLEHVDRPVEVEPDDLVALTVARRRP